MPELGVNIDHVATLRQARGGSFPDPVYAALLSEQAGASSIVAHLREDRRHIQDSDIVKLRKNLKTRLNLEMSVNPGILKIACRIKPFQVTLVPEKRKELTTEGGLDVRADFKRIAAVLNKLHKTGIRASLFIDPDISQIAAAKEAGAKIIELHTGRYAQAKNVRQINKFFKQITAAVSYACNLGLTVNAGHGLGYENAKRIAGIRGINELNIGYAIIARALYTGLFKAVKNMSELIK